MLINVSLRIFFYCWFILDIFLKIILEVYWVVKNFIVINELIIKEIYINLLVVIIFLFLVFNLELFFFICGSGF